MRLLNNEEEEEEEAGPCEGIGFDVVVSDLGEVEVMATTQLTKLFTVDLVKLRFYLLFDIWIETKLV